MRRRPPPLPARLRTCACASSLSARIRSAWGRKGLAFRRHHHAARAAAQERAVEDIFQSANLLADRGLSAPQGLGGAAHAAGADGGDEAAQGGGVDISCHKAIL